MIKFSDRDTARTVRADTNSRDIRRRVRYACVAAAGVAGLIGVVACSGSTSSGSGTPAAAAAPSSSSTRASGNAPGFGAGAPPAAAGTIASVSNGVMEVQDPGAGQTTVKFGASTRITAAQTATLAAVKPGLCITALSTTSTSSASGAPSAGTGRAPAGPRDITATVVMLTPAINGSCGARVPGARPNGGGRRSASPSNGAPPSSAPSRNGGFAGRGLAAFVTGQVESVSGTVVTVQSVRRTGSSTSSAATTETDTVRVTSATAYNETLSATANALVVGKCATAQGTADSTGAVTATRIAVTDPGQQGCRVGGRFGFGGNGPGAAASPSAS